MRSEWRTFRLRCLFPVGKAAFFGLVSGIAIEIELANEHHRVAVWVPGSVIIPLFVIGQSNRVQRPAAPMRLRKGTLAARRHHERWSGNYRSQTSSFLARKANTGEFKQRCRWRVNMIKHYLTHDESRKIGFLHVPKHAILKVNWR